MRRRWVAVGVLCLSLFAINVIARVITNVFNIENGDDQAKLVLYGMIATAVILIAATAWWAARYPFSRVFFDIGAAVVVAAFLSLIIGPLVGGATPFTEGLATFVGEVLMFLAIAAVGFFLGFAGMMTFGRDYKSKRLRNYEQTYNRRPRRPVRG